LFEEVLATSRRVLGPEHPNTLLAKVGLGTNRMYRGELDAAEQTLVESLVEIEPVLGAEHPFYTATLGLVGRVYERQGKLDRALEVAEQVLAQQLLTLPPHSTLVTRSRVSVMQLYSQLDRHDEAIGIARGLVEADRAREGATLRPSLARLANELRAGGRCAEALPLVAEADPESAKPQLFQDTGTLLAVRGLCAYERGELESARDDLERAFERLEPEVGTTPPLVRRVSSTLLDIYQRSDDDAAARAHRARVEG
jgi:tetratricopeptide (TPR) repeat protein